MRLSRPIAIMFFLSAFSIASPGTAAAEVSCYRFDVQADAQNALDALPNDPYGLDQGRVPIQDGEVDAGDVQAGNGAPCDRLPPGASASDRTETGHPQLAVPWFVADTSQPTRCKQPSFMLTA